MLLLITLLGYPCVTSTLLAPQLLVILFWTTFGQDKVLVVYIAVQVVWQCVRCGKAASDAMRRN
uniref:Uncharacterized protein n=1 Tax=Setaria digitata TaxID=48799 RepID=A0A915Q280_9BILA